MKDSTRREVERQLEAVREGAEAFVGEEELAGRLASCLETGRPLRVKLGLDPSAPDIHIGHTGVPSKLRRFQELGHTAIFLVGDFTARIGDPSGRKKTRPALDDDAVRANAATYVEQVSTILDVSRAEIRYNSEWMGAMGPADFVRLCSKSTVLVPLKSSAAGSRTRRTDCRFGSMVPNSSIGPGPARDCRANRSGSTHTSGAPVYPPPPAGAQSTTS